MANYDTDLLKKLYEISSKDSATQFAFYQKGIAFHFGLVSALIGATVAGFIQAKPGYQYGLLLAIPLMALVAAILGVKSTERLYRAWLEKITFRAKVECELGLTSKIEGQSDGNWSNEPIVFSRYIEDRARYNSSREFVTDRLQHGYHRWVRWLFVCSAIVAALMCVAIATALYLSV